MKIIHVSVCMAAAVAFGLVAHRIMNMDAASSAVDFESSRSPVVFMSASSAYHASVSCLTNAVSQTAPSPKSFNSSKDVWQFAQAALASGSEARVHEGYIAARECSGFSSSWEDLSTFAGGGSGTHVFGALTPERQLAIQTLAVKCGGFMSAGKRKSLELVKNLERRQRELGDSIGSAEKNLNSPSERKEAVSLLLLSESPSAVETGLSGLVDVWAAANHVAPNDPRMEYVATASLLAACDLGKDCGAQSYSTQLRCALQGECHGSLWQNWADGMSQEEVQAVTDFRKLIQTAVQRRDLSLLGIDKRKTSAQ